MQQPGDVEPELGPGDRTVERTLERTLVGEPVVGPERLLRIALAHQVVRPSRSTGIIRTAPVLVTGAVLRVHRATLALRWNRPPLSCPCNARKAGQGRSARSAARHSCPAPASAGGTSFEFAAIGDREPFRAENPERVRRCGAGRDDEVDSAASVSPGPRRRVRPGRAGTGSPVARSADRPLQRGAGRPLRPCATTSPSVAGGPGLGPATNRDGGPG